MNLLFVLLVIFADREFVKMTRKGSDFVVDMVGTSVSTVIVAGEAVRLRQQENVASLVRSLRRTSLHSEK